MIFATIVFAVIIALVVLFWGQDLSNLITLRQGIISGIIVYITNSILKKIREKRQEKEINKITDIIKNQLNIYGKKLALIITSIN